MKLQHSQILLIEALVDGELKGQELLSAMQVMSSSYELKELYHQMKSQKDAIRQAFLLTTRKN